MSDTNEFLQSLWAMNHLNVDLQTRVALKLDERDRRIRELAAGLAKWGDHASNCAYRLTHYKGPVPACDCGWNEHVASLTPNSGDEKHANSK